MGRLVVSVLDLLMMKINILSIQNIDPKLYIYDIEKNILKY